MSFLDSILIQILYGLTVGSFGFAVGLGLKNFAIPRVKQHIFDLANAYIAGFIENLQKNPELAESLAKPFIAAALKELQGPQNSQGGKSKGFKIAGITIPGEIVQGILERLAGNFLGSKKSNSQTVLQLPEG